MIFFTIKAHFDGSNSFPLFIFVILEFLLLYFSYTSGITIILFYIWFKLFNKSLNSSLSIYSNFLKAHSNTMRIIINCSIYFMLYFNNIVICKLWAFHFILLFVNFFLRLTSYLTLTPYIIYYQHFLNASFMSLYSFTKINLLWLIYESIKTLDIKTSMAFNLVFANNAIFWYFCLFVNCTNF